MRLNEFTEQPVEEGYYDLPNQDDLPGMYPIDFSSNPSFKDIIDRYIQLVYQGHTSETSPEEDQEHDEIEQYVAQRFGEKGSAHLQKAAEVSYWGRDDGHGSGHIRSSNLGRPNQPGGNFRTTRAGKMHGQDAKVMKAKVADRLGRHPEPSLPEGVEEAGIPFRGTAGAFNRGDDERHDLDVPRPTIYALKINGKIWQKDGNVVTFFTKERALAARNSILNKRPELEVGLVQRQD